ncbi:MAG: hypothetical protein ACRCY4_01220, partial [Brevinema sp.]
MNISVAFFMVFFAAFLWGSWGQFVKRIGAWPLQYFMLGLYFFSLFVTWGALFSLESGKISSMFQYLAENPQFALYPLTGGMIFSLGMWYNIVAVSMSGLAITYIIFSSISIILGTGISALLGGLPENASLFYIFLGGAL